MDHLPELRTDRLILRAPSWRDIPQIVNYAGDRLIADTTATIPHPYEERHAIQWLHLGATGLAEQSRYIFGLYLLEEQQFIGGMGLHRDSDKHLAELGYWIAVPHWGRGYATEAAGAVLRFGFETLALEKIYARHMTDNPGSGRVMIKNGMVLEGEFKHHAEKDGALKDLRFYRMLKSEYLAQQY